MLGQNLAGGHIVHCAALPIEYVPGVQATCLVESDVFGQAEPGGQGVQSVAATSLYVPEGKSNMEVVALSVQNNMLFLVRACSMRQGLSHNSKKKNYIC